MKINFRQGIVSSYAAGLTPLFLAPSPATGFVDLVVSPDPTVVAFAHGDGDYLQVFNADVSQAWGPLVSGQDAFLYWEIDQLTANIQYKITRYPALATPTAPVSPPVDQHWFDLSTATMKYWTGTKWLPKIAVFAGSALGGVISQLQPSGYGSQVGLNTPSDPGFIMLSSLLKPIYTNPATFEFLTTTKSVRIKTTSGTSGILATPPNAFIPVRASENIPAFSLVYFSGEDTVGLASSSLLLTSPRIPIGIVQTDLSTNEMGNVTQSGEVQWDQWNWTGHFGKPLYCTSDGQITHIRPVGLMAYRIGFVKNRNTIVFGVDAETMPQVYQVTANDIIVSGVTPLSSSFSTNGIGERVWSVEISDATPSARGAMTAAQATLLGTHTAQIADNAFEVTQRAALNHGHAIADVTGLQGELDGKSNVGHNHDLLYSPLGHNHDLLYSPLGHAHTIADITGLQSAINLNLESALSLKSDVGHGHTLAEVTGLAAALALKSDVGHNHDLLYSPLGHNHDLLYSPLGHAHIIADITGLQSALNLKSDVGHGHAISEVTGLVAALALKSDVGHSHDLLFTDKILLGHTSSIIDYASNESRIQVSGAGGGNSRIMAVTYSNDTIGPAMVLMKSRSETIGSGFTATQLGDSTGSIVFAATNGTSFVRNCAIEAFAGATGTLATGVPGVLTFNTAPASAANTLVERLRINSIGQVMIGITAPVTQANNTQAGFSVGSTESASSRIAASIFRNDTNAPGLVFTKSRGATAGAHGLVQNGDSLGFIPFEGSTGTAYARGVIISAAVDGTASSSSMPGKLTFSTTPSGSTIPVERLSLNASGSWSVNSSAGTTGQVLTSAGSGASPTWQSIPAPPAPTKLERVTTFDANALGKRVALTAGITIPSATYTAGDAFSLYNNTASPLTITQGASLTLRQDGTTSTGNRTLAPYGTCFVWFNTASEAVISGSVS